MFCYFNVLISWVLGEGLIDPGYHYVEFIWNDFDKFRTGPRTTLTVSATGTGP